MIGFACRTLQQKLDVIDRKPRLVLAIEVRKLLDVLAVLHLLQAALLIEVLDEFVDLRAAFADGPYRSKQHTQRLLISLDS